MMHQDYQEMSPPSVAVAVGPLQHHLIEIVYQHLEEIITAVITIAVA